MEPKGKLVFFMKKYSFFFLFLPSWINQSEKKRRRRRREKFLAHEIHVDHTQSRQIFSTVVGFDSANAAIVKSSYNRTIKLTITSRFEREKKGTEFLSFSSVELLNFIGRCTRDTRRCAGPSTPGSRFHPRLEIDLISSSTRFIQSKTNQVQLFSLSLR